MGTSTTFDQWSVFSANGVGANGVENGVATNARLFVYNDWSTSSDIRMGDATPWVLAYRSGIYWKKECSAEGGNARKKDVVDNMDPVASLLQLQWALLMVQILIGMLILGCAVPGVTLYNMFSPKQDVPCVPGEGAEEFKRISI